MGEPIDWSKAGVRLRRTPSTDGRNPDWDWVNKRWKDEADYAGETLTVAQVIDRITCPECGAIAGAQCLDARGAVMGIDSIHNQRRRAAGEACVGKAQG